MEEGLYEALVTETLLETLNSSSELSDFGAIDPADQPHVFARHIGAMVEQLLEGAPKPDRERIANQFLLAIDQESQRIAPPARQLLRVVSDSPGRDAKFRNRPSTPLSDAALLTNMRGEPSLGSELAAEFESADEVDLLCAFVKWYGIRVIEQELRDFHHRGGKLRVITTTYMGATERAALDRLVRDFGAEVRINFNESKTRLHAKAWHFHRNSGFDTAYIGSSNLSRSALLDGLEWNVRLAKHSTGHLLEKFEGTFETYWNDDAFEQYDPNDVTQRDRLDDALALASGVRSQDDTLNLSGLEVRPYPFQQQMLDALDAQRQLHDRHRNLLVAATGTGKTVVAALDYRRLAAGKQLPRLLFVAHRKEILEQSRRTYREVLANGSFGEFYVDGARPERWDHVFASVQSLNSYGIENIPSGHFDVVVVDEFHHAAAASYRSLLNHLEPRELLALTATPERADGSDVRSFFDNRTAAELRLWDALQQGILCPFHYFMVADNTDLSDLTWKRGRYDETELEEIFTGNDARTRIVLGELRDKVIAIDTMQALGFCVGVRHAQYMAQRFNEAGIKARALSGVTPSAERRQTLNDLREGRVQIVFSADLLNEGIDIPDVDTVLFLRPTESATVFLQQLGRGLRQRPGKPVLTVLDFVGNQRAEFRFDQKLHALTGRPLGRLADDVDAGFPFLPAGCRVVLDEQSQDVVLKSLKAQITARWPQMVAQLRALPSAENLADYLTDSGYRLADVIKSGRSWTRLQREAGRELPPAGAQEEHLLKRVRALSHIDDPARAAGYRALMNGEPVSPSMGEMLFYTLWPDGGGFSCPEEGLALLKQEPAAVAELSQVLAIAFDEADRPLKSLRGDLAFTPLQLHARYQREEILAGLGWTATGKKPNSMREGVTYIAERNLDVFFITLKKSEAAYSPTTLYRDYPINHSLFHWESQSTTSAASPTGRRYIRGESQVLLFVREEQKNEFGTAPYLCLGTAHPLAHKGEKPIAMQYELDDPMPADCFSSWTIAASA